MSLKFLKENIDITNLSNFKTKAFAKYYFEVHNRQDIEKVSEIYQFAKNKNLKLLFIWWGTNLLFAFDNFDWVVIKNCLQWWIYDEETKILETFSNEKIWDIAESLENDYWQNLWHRFIWLPWSIWWAVFGNAWCFWLETEGNFLEAEVLNLENWEVEIIDKPLANFSYRNSIFKENEKYFIIKIKFDLSKNIEKYSSDVDNIDFRKNKQPKWNSCWSFFKNPSKELSAWFAIQEVWLKGYSHNWAYFSELHWNFLMSDSDKCRWQDLIYLINLAKEKVREKFWIELEAEVRIIKN